MSQDFSALALVETHTLPIRHSGEVHRGKVRSVYWFTQEDSARLIREQSYDVRPRAQLGAMVISDRISAFDCIWQGEWGLQGVPGKGAALNAISHYWFKEFEKAGLAGNHVLDVPHPLVWIVERAEPVKVEAIPRQYITGSMWRDYAAGKREICGIPLPEGLREHQRLNELLVTPSTKGTLRGIPGVPEEEDVNITRQQIIDNYEAFGFLSREHVPLYEQYSREGFGLAERKLEGIDQIIADTKFEFGYRLTPEGNAEMIYIDEVLTPDSSRFWNGARYREGKIVENSKEGFRQYLLQTLERDILLNKKRMPERKELAATYRVPVDAMMDVSRMYIGIAEQITGQRIPLVWNALQEILDALSSYGIVE